MHIKTIIENLKLGKTVTYRIRRLRGYLWGNAELVFQPSDLAVGESNLSDRLRNFRFDEKPYDQPKWEVR